MSIIVAEGIRPWACLRRYSLNSSNVRRQKPLDQLSTYRGQPHDRNAERVAKLAAESGRLDYRVLTSDADTTRRVIAGHPALELVPAHTRLRLGEDAVVARANTAALSVCLASGPVGYVAPA